MDFPNKGGGGEPVVHNITSAGKKIEPVVSGAVEVKRPALRRLKDHAFAESPKDIAGKIGRDVLVPRIKEGLEAAIMGFVRSALGTGGTTSLSSQLIQGTVLRPGGATPYYGIANPSPATLAATANQSRPSAGGYQDFAFATQVEAETLLANMYDLLNQYRMVAVGDYYELADKTPPQGSDRYGWYGLEGARISKQTVGYVVELPRPTLI